MTKENAQSIIRRNLYTIQHLPKKYINLNRILQNQRIRYFLYDIFNYIKDKDVVIYRHKYCYHLDTFTLTKLRHKSSIGTTSRYVNYLCCIGLLNKQYQNPSDINNMTHINASFKLHNCEKNIINVFYIREYNKKELNRLERRADKLLKNNITQSKICNKILRINGLDDIAKEVYFSNTYKSLKKDEKDYNLINKRMKELCDEQGYIHKEVLYEIIELSKKRIDFLIKLYKKQLQEVYIYKRPNKYEKIKYGLKTNKFIYILK